MGGSISILAYFLHYVCVHNYTSRMNWCIGKSSRNFCYRSCTIPFAIITRITAAVSVCHLVLSSFSKQLHSCAHNHMGKYWVCLCRENSSDSFGQINARYHLSWAKFNSCCCSISRPWINDLWWLTTLRVNHSTEYYSIRAGKKTRCGIGWFYHTCNSSIAAIALQQPTRIYTCRFRQMMCLAKGFIGQYSPFNPCSPTFSLHRFSACGKTQPVCTADGDKLQQQGVLRAIAI